MSEGVQSLFLKAMRRFASTVTIVSAGTNHERHGSTATAVTSVSADPPSLLVCLNHSSRMYETVKDRSHFCVNFLHADDVETSRVYSTKLSSSEKFNSGQWDAGPFELPFLTTAQANLFCEKRLVVPYETHSIVIGRVISAKIREDISPLLYQNGRYSTVTDNI